MNKFLLALRAAQVYIILFLVLTGGKTTSVMASTLCISDNTCTLLALCAAHVHSTAYSALVVEEAQIFNVSELSEKPIIYVGNEIKEFQSFFLPTQLRNDDKWQSSLRMDVWGTGEPRNEWSTEENPVFVGARDENNGLEPKGLSTAPLPLNRGEHWSYWDGTIIRGDDGTYHLFASGWDKTLGHGGWTRSLIIHAISDDLFGPYEFHQLPTWQYAYGNIGPGAGHNVLATELHPDDESGFRYAITTSDDSNPGSRQVYGSNCLWEWTRIGRFFQLEGSPGTVNFSGNFTPKRAAPYAPFNYISISRRFDIATADNIVGPWTPRNNGFASATGPGPASPTQDMEDPTIFYMDGLYHIVMNAWGTMRAYWYVSPTGIDNWRIMPGYGYNQRDANIYYELEDGTIHINHWNLMERPDVFFNANNELVSFNFSLLNSSKRQDAGNNDRNASKIGVVPFDGEAFKRYVWTQVTHDFTEIRASANAHVAGNDQGANFGSAVALEVRNSPFAGDIWGETTPAGEDNPSTISYLKFDISQFAAAGAIGNAQLELVYSNKAGWGAGINPEPRTFTYIYVVTADNDWTETGINWQNKPTLNFDGGVAVSSHLEISTASRFPNRTVHVDVTEFVNRALARGETEITLAFNATYVAHQTMNFHSRNVDAANQRMAPKLNIVARPDLTSAIAAAEAALAAKQPGVFANPIPGVNATLRAVIDRVIAVNNDAGIIGMQEVVASRELQDAINRFENTYAALDR